MHVVETPYIVSINLGDLLKVMQIKKAIPPPAWLFLENKQQQV